MQPRCPSADAYISYGICVCVCEYMYIYVYNGLLLSHKKECIWVSANEVDESRTYYTEWSKSESEKHKYCILTHIHEI